MRLKLPKPTSNHASILLDCGGLRRGPTPFRFENMWLKAYAFKDLLKDWRLGLSINGMASYRLSRKLKELKVLLKA